MEAPPDPLDWPLNAAVNEEWIAKLATVFEYASWKLAPADLQTVFPAETADKLLLTAYKILHKEPNIAEVKVNQVKDGKATLVGDVHGQLHDVLNLFKLTGKPTETSFLVFNGDYVDRGAWGVETYLYLLAWKVYLPQQVILLRGNHETKFCVSNYGFEAECMAKFGANGRHLFRRFLACFESHPLAALIAGSVYVCHGGLFREHQPPQKKGGRKGGKGGGKSSRSKGGRDSTTLQLGTLTDLSKARRTILDPCGSGSHALPADVLWSDPGKKPGLSLNLARGIGLLFGPDCTQEFLVKNGLKLIVRSHEGPDARDKRPDMDPMDKGYTIDHEVAAGRLITLFSAPDYPQFQASKHRYNNKGAFIVLEAPTYTDPKCFTFEAVLPRPQAKPFYDYMNGLDSDEDLNMASCSEGSSDGSDAEDVT